MSSNARAIPVSNAFGRSRASDRPLRTQQGPMSPMQPGLGAHGEKIRDCGQCNGIVTETVPRKHRTCRCSRAKCGEPGPYPGSPCPFGRSYSSVSVVLSAQPLTHVLVVIDPDQSLPCPVRGSRIGSQNPCILETSWPRDIGATARHRARIRVLQCPHRPQRPTGVAQLRRQISRG